MHHGIKLCKTLGACLGHRPSSEIPKFVIDSPLFWDVVVMASLLFLTITPLLLLLYLVMLVRWFIMHKTDIFNYHRTGMWLGEAKKISETMAQRATSETMVSVCVWMGGGGKSMRGSGLPFIGGSGGIPPKNFEIFGYKSWHPASLPGLWHTACDKLLSWAKDWIGFFRPGVWDPRARQAPEARASKELADQIQWVLASFSPYFITVLPGIDIQKTSLNFYLRSQLEV